MNRHLNFNHHLASPQNLRLGALVLALICISQIDDPLVDASIGQELLFWLARHGVFLAGHYIAIIFVARFMSGRLAKPAWLKPVVIVSAIGLLPLALVEILIEPYLPMRPEYVDDALWAYSPLLAWLSEYLTFFTIVVPIHLLLWLVIDRPAIAGDIAAQELSEAVPDFLRETSIARAEDVLALKAEEHYLRVYVQTGSELLHCRFRDALTQMPAELGLQVHRSWWVAANAVRSAQRGTRRWQLNLTVDIRVPVSDSYVGAVRERGWLKRKTATVRE